MKSVLKKKTKIIIKLNMFLVLIYIRNYLKDLNESYRLTIKMKNMVNFLESICDIVFSYNISIKIIFINKIKCINMTSQVIYDLIEFSMPST